MQALLRSFSRQDRLTQVGFTLIGIALAIALYGGLSQQIWILCAAMISTPVIGMVCLARGSMTQDRGQWNQPVLRKRKEKRQ